MKEELEAIGLTGNEAKVYELLTNYDSLSGTDVAKKTGLDRSVSYNILSSLTSKGIISSAMRNNKKSFFITDPSHLTLDLERKQAIASSLVSHIRQLKPKISKEKNVEIYDGVGGSRALYKVLAEHKNETLCCMGGSGKIMQDIRLNIPHYIHVAQANNLRLKTIVPPNYDHHPEVYKHVRSEVKYFPIPLIHASINVIGDVVAIHEYEEEPLVILLRNPVVAHLVKTLFDVIWDIAE